MSITHGLNEDIAKQTGVNSALLFERIRHYCEYHKTNKNHCFEGIYWCFNSYKAWQEQFPFLSERQIRTAIDKLEQSDLIIVGNHNRKAYDKTKWYALKHNDTPMTQKSEGYDTEVRTPVTEVRPIPEYTHQNNITIGNAHDKRGITDDVLGLWNAMASVHGLETVRTNILNTARKRHILNRLADCKNDVSLLAEAISNVPKNPHWLGHNEKGWRANFDWVFSASRFPQVLEYTPTEIKNAKPTSSNKSTAQQRAEQRSYEADEIARLALQSPLLR